MSQVETSIWIDAQPAAVWEVALDPHRLGDWVTIHRSLHRSAEYPLSVGDTVEQTLALRGAPFKVKWKVTGCEPPLTAVWEGSGPARSKAVTRYTLEPERSGTRFSYVNEFRPPAGVVGRVAASALVGGLPEVEAKASLKRLKALIEQGA
jgi:uncharacterized protein YndB with AHSA1/START domain